MAKIPNKSLMFEVSGGNIWEFDALYAELPIEFLKVTGRVTAWPDCGLPFRYTVKITPYLDAQPLPFADLLDMLAMLDGAPRHMLQVLAERLRTPPPKLAQDVAATLPEIPAHKLKERRERVRTLYLDGKSRSEIAATINDTEAVVKKDLEWLRERNFLPPKAEISP